MKRINTGQKILIVLSICMFALSSCEQEPQKRVNILFAISDDQSFAHTGFAGCEFVNTPAFDRIASEGVYFTNCYAGSPGCAPSRSTIATGRYHWQNEQAGQHASAWLKKFVPFIDMLDLNGYKTGRAGKGVSPFQYARDDNDSLWRATDAGGIIHSDIRYEKGSPEDERTAKGIGPVNYFENFKFFMEKVRDDEPFFFWYGCKEPHLSYEEGSWKRNGKKLADAEVPAFLPDHPIIRGDLLDYAVEIDWFDVHLQRMLDYLEEIGELENTIVIVTSDNGLPFPRGKANAYEFGVRVPFAVSFPKEFPGGRIVEDPISFADLAPTILELTGSSSEGMLPMSGKSFADILNSEEQGIVDSEREYAFAGRERHSCSRYQNWGYPQRVIRSKDYLLIWNMKPERWPAGAPQRYDPDNPEKLLPKYGIAEDGKFTKGWAYTDIGYTPTKAFLIENRDDPKVKPYFDMAHARRPEFELYDVKQDLACLNNLFGVKEYKDIQEKMKQALIAELKKSEDTRVVGPDKEIFDSYLRYSPMREFPPPEYDDISN